MAIFHSSNNRFNLIYWKILTPLSRFWGVFTAVVLFGVGVDQCYHQHKLGIYLIVVALSIFILEIAWIVNVFIEIYRLDNDDLIVRHKCWKIWPSLASLNLWKKSLIYFLLSPFLFIKPHKLWLCKISGIQIISLSCIYALMFIQYHLKIYADRRYDIIMSMDPMSMEMKAEGEDNYRYHDIADDTDKNGEILDIDEDPMLTM